MSTTLDLQSEVLGAQFSSSQYGARSIKWLDEGHKKVARRVDLRALQTSATLTTVAGTATCPLPTNFSRLKSITYPTNQDSIVPMTEREYDEATSQTGLPERFVVIESNVYFYPTPDNVYNFLLRYYKMPDTLSISGTVVNPILPDDYDDVLINYALSRAYLAEHDSSFSDFHTNLFEQGISRLQADLQSDTFEGPKQVPGTWSVWN